MDAMIQDEDLMRAAAAGDVEAFQAMVARFTLRLVAFLDRFLGDRARACDLTQEAFLRLFKRAREGGEHPGDAISLLYTIAANLGRDELRRRRVRRESPFVGMLERPAAGPAPDAGIEREEDDARVRAALARLTPDVRLLLILRDVDGQPYERIAEILAVPLGTVKSRINRARLAFRDQWTALGAREDRP